MKTIKIETSYREGTGKGRARKLRDAGLVPGVLYGHHEDTIPVSVNEQELRRILSSGETLIFDLMVTGKVTKECNAIIKDVQQHPASGRVLHVDFQHVRRGEKIRLEVPVHLTGAPRGVKEQGGILEHGLRVVEIRVLPRDIPDDITIDVTELGIHDAVHLKDIAVKYPNLEFLDDLESTLAIVVPPKVEAEPVAVVEEEEAAEPEVIAKGKEGKEEEEEEGGEEK